MECNLLYICDYNIIFGFNRGHNIMLYTYILYYIGYIPSIRICPLCLKKKLYSIYKNMTYLTRNYGHT